MSTTARLSYAKLTLAGIVLLQSCALSRTPKMLNCSKQGRGGIWIEADTTDSGDVIYATSRYKNGLKHGAHFAYRQTATGLMWRREKGRYRHGKKAGFWRYYTTCGRYVNWVYYWGEQGIHARIVNSVYSFQSCPCDSQ